MTETTSVSYQDAVTLRRIEIGRQLLNLIEDSERRGNTMPVDVWREYVGQQAIAIVEGVRG